MTSFARKLALPAAITAVAALAAAFAPGALAGRVPVTGAVYTTVNAAVDGDGKCKNGSPTINCNIYVGKPYVWLNGGPTGNKLGPDGQYFFAVLAPGGQPNPNDGGKWNLSDDFDTYQNRTFTVTNGEISGYGGTHDFDAAARLLRLYPYADSPNQGGVYIMAVCSIGDGTKYPVDPSSCKYDAFKAPSEDPTPPVCVLTATGTDASGRKYIQVTVQDPSGPADSGSGIEDIVVDRLENATLTYSPDPWYVGTLSPVTITATKVDPTKSSFLQLTVHNVAGLKTTCDPEVPGVKIYPKRSATLARPVLLNRRGGR
jgi:hypothetical protein